MKFVRRMTTMSLSLFLAGLLGATFFGLVMFPVPHASAATLTNAQAQRVWVGQQIVTQLKREPGGKLIAWNELAYEGGKLLVQFPTSPTTAVSPNTGYGGCPEGYTCVWHGTNYSGLGVFINATFCPTGPVVDLTNYGFIGIGSYSSTNGATEPEDVIDQWQNPDFWILPGVQHHTPNANSNSDAQYARWVSCGLG